ncbi:MAG: hypothetical protein CM15mV99_170 [Caudoviricetes sp.]|nr:MAG: hypothetical protein CM15mV99_170 [Caudoviricetes sp.]
MDHQHFNLPDLRGHLLRGWDNKCWLDSAGSFASSQTDQNKQHTHSVTDPGHQHNTVTNCPIFPLLEHKIQLCGVDIQQNFLKASNRISLVNQRGYEGLC